MLHALALVEVEYGGAKQLFEPFLKVTFIDGHFTAQFLNGDGLTNMLEQDLAGANDLLPIGIVGQELTLEGFDGLIGIFIVAQHTLKAVEEQHLHLRIDVNVFEAASKGMVKQSFQHRTGATAKGQYLGERRRMRKLEDIVCNNMLVILAPGL